MAIEKIKILGAILKLPAEQTALPIWPIWPNFEVNGLDWQCFLADSSKTALIFSIAMDADSSFYLKVIATYWVYYFSLRHCELSISKLGSSGYLYLKSP